MHEIHVIDVQVLLRGADVCRGQAVVERDSTSEAHPGPGSASAHCLQAHQNQRKGEPPHHMFLARVTFSTSNRC